MLWRSDPERSVNVIAAAMSPFRPFGYSARKQDYPLDPSSIVDTDAIWLLAYDIRYLEAVYRHKSDMALPPRVRKKYETTWRLLMRRHRGFMSTIEENGFN